MGLGPAMLGFGRLARFGAEEIAARIAGGDAEMARCRDEDMGYGARIALLGGEGRDRRLVLAP